MKIKVMTKLRQSPVIEIDGVDIMKMDYEKRIEKLNQIMMKIPDLPHWFEEFLFALCLQFGEELPGGDIYEFTHELEL